MKKLLFLLVITGFITSCSKSDEDRREDDEIIIQNYLLDEGITAEEIGETGVYYRITEPGDNADSPDISSTVRTFYKGYVIGGEDTPFDERVEGEDDELTIGLSSLVYGWQVALPKFSKGAKGQIFIPSYAGYGSTERQGIPANSILIFDIHLVNFF